MDKTHIEYVEQGGAWFAEALLVIDGFAVGVWSVLFALSFLN